MTPDHLHALIEYLKGNADVAGAVAARVFGGELPDAENAHMPRAAVVLKHGGGANAIGSGAQSYGDVRVDAWTYGTTPKDASDIWLVVHGALKSLEREVSVETLLHWCRPAGGPLPFRDPDTGWPYIVSSWQVLRSEVAVA